MRMLQLLGWVAVTTIALASPVFAQTSSTSNAFSGTTGAAGASGIGGTTTTGGSTSSNSATSGGASLAATTLASTTIPPINPPASTQNSSSNQAISPSNFLQNTYGAVYYQGRANANTTNNNPGGLGTPLYTATGGANTTTTGGRLGGAGGAGSGLTSHSGGVAVPLPRYISYPAQVKFTRQPFNSARLQADLSGSIARSSSLTQPAGVRLQVSGRDVIVRGNVLNTDEARLVEGLIRLTPGVGRIQNELVVMNP